MLLLVFLMGETDFLGITLVVFIESLTTRGLFSLCIGLYLLTTNLAVEGWFFLIGLIDFLFCEMGVLLIWFVVLFLRISCYGSYCFTL